MSEDKACAALIADDARVAAAAQQVVRHVLGMGTNSATLPLDYAGKRYVVSVIPVSPTVMDCPDWTVPSDFVGSR